MIRLAGLAAAVAVVAVSTAYAQQGAPVQAQDVWARATPPRASVGVAYMTLTSPGGDTLTGVSSPVSQTAEVHEMRMEGTVMRMRAVEGGLELPAGKPVALAPGGLHVMLQGLKAPLQPGQSVPLHLTFRNAPPLDVQAQVRANGAAHAGAGAPAGGGGMPGMGMGH